MTGSGIRGFAIGAATATMVLLPAMASAESAGKPANICKELVAFLHPPAQPTSAGPAKADTSTAVTAPGTGSQKPSGASDTQRDSGLSGPTAQSGPGAAGPQGASQNAAAPSGASAQAPAPAAAAASATPAAPPPKTPSAASIEQGDAVANANDIAGCQRVARQIRRDGVVMPAPLMSLAALDLKYLEAAQ
ncbi:hypothetical protein [Methylobacterium marchantiae]|uniref:Uncharacterized protein n=1 Tax=Methylobacterium marchantiae TaxID=600331 RepID=A0ABW3X0I9_9HYPH|nr:hypothetical protein AIGOOFII_0701 [Methylobacterium marchantiae]